MNFGNVNWIIPSTCSKYFGLGQALLQTMFHSKTYPFEGALSAKVEYECRMRGAQRMA